MYLVSLLSDYYIELLRGTRELSIGTMVRNPTFVLNAKRQASRRAETLLRAVLKNPQFSERGVLRARIDFDLGLIYEARGHLELARAHFDEARKIASAQEAVALIAKIDAAKTSLGYP